jgi:hypothetical protein
MKRMLMVLLLVVGSGALAQDITPSLPGGVPNAITTGRSVTAPTTDPLSIMQPVQQFALNLCGSVRSLNFGSLDFLCTASGMLTDVGNMITNFQSDMASFVSELGGDMLSDLVNTMASGLGANQLDQHLAGMRNDLASAPGRIKGRLRASASMLVRDSIGQLFAGKRGMKLSDATNLATWARIVNPELGAQEIVNEVQKGKALLAAGDALAASTSSAALANKLSQADAGQNLSKKVNGDLLSGDVGKAELLRQNVGRAVSTRSAIQNLTEGIADAMSIQATAAMNNEAYAKAMAMQASYTNAQLATLVNLEAQARADALEEESGAVEEAMAEVWQDVVVSTETVNRMRRSMDKTSNVEINW